MHHAQAPRRPVRVVFRVILAVFVSRVGCTPEGPSAVTCIREVNRAFEGTAFAQRSLVAACMRSAGAGAELGVADCIAMDADGEVARASRRTIDAEARWCQPGSLPAVGYGGADAANRGAVTSALALAHGIFGRDLDAAVRSSVAEGAEAQCQQQVFDAADACAALFLNAYDRCAVAAVEAGSSDAIDLIRCKSNDDHGAVAAACDAGIASAVAAGCGAVDVASLFPGCAGDVAACVRAHTRRSASDAVNEADALCHDVLVGSLPEPQLLQCFEPPAQEPVIYTQVPLPAGVNPATAEWSDDGASIWLTYPDSAAGGTQLATVAPDGSGFRCLTCATGLITGNLKPVGLFSDGQRALVAGPNNPNPKWRVLECTPSLLDCHTSVLIPIQLPANPDATTPILQYRVPWVTPDGAWFIWTEVRLRGPGGNLSAMGRLVREPTRYFVSDARVIAPQFDPSLLGSDSDRWRDFGQAFEAKGGWMRGGRDWVEAGSPGAGHYDAQLIDLATGAMRRITRDPDHDESIEFSSDEQWAVVHSGRTDNRVGFLGLLPRPPYIDWLAFSVHFVGIAGQPGDGISPGGNPNERDCYVDPWLLDRWLERGDYIGQRLSKPADGRESSGGNGGSFDWSPDGTKISLLDQQWKRLTPPGEVQPSRLRIATLPSRAPIDPAQVVPMVPTPEPTWAVRYEDWIVPDTAGDTVIPGKAAGTATIHNELANVLQGFLRLDYDHYSDDGLAFLDGFESIDIPDLINIAVYYDVDLVMTGLHQGSMQGSILYDFANDENVGEVVASFDGQTLTGPHTCYDAGLIPIP